MNGTNSLCRVCTTMKIIAANIMACHTAGIDMYIVEAPVVHFRGDTWASSPAASARTINM